MPQYQITREKFLSREEFGKLLKVCGEQAELDRIKGRKTWITRHMLVALALRTGLRVGEIANLKIGHIHLRGKETRLSVINGKRGKDRDVYFNGSLANPLRHYLEIKARSWQEPCSPDDYLFCSKVKDGKSLPYTTTALHLSFKEALKKANLPLHHTIHHARHTFATYALADTGDLRYVQKQLGHDNLAFTVLYADIAPEHGQRMAEKVTI